MKLEVGKKYVSHGGEVVEITACDDRQIYYQFEGSNGNTYTPNGVYCMVQLSRHDLIEEVQEETMNEISIQEAYRILQAASGFEVGDKVRCVRHFKMFEGGSSSISSLCGSKQAFVDDKAVGTISAIDKGAIHVDCGIEYLGARTFPFFTLELVGKGGKLPAPIQLDSGEYSVEFKEAGNIKVGCQNIKFKTLEEIYLTAKGVRE